MRKAGPFGLVAVLLLLALASLLGGCDDSVDPFLETDRQLTLYGTLDMARDTQFVRVVPIRERLRAPEPDGPLELAFTTTDLETGRTVTWRDSIVAFDNGTYGHVFYAPLRVRPGHTYRIEASPAGSNLTTTARTTAPETITPFVRPEQVSGGAGLITREPSVFWEGLTREPHRTEHWYRFLPTENSSFIDVKLPYEPSNESYQRCGIAGCTEIGRRVTLDLRRDRDSLRERINIGGPALVGLGMRVTTLDGQFVPPGGVFDEEVQLQPGTFSNVTNGFGFVGSVGRFDVEWTLRNETMRVLGYKTFREVFGKRAPPPEQCPPLPRPSL